MSIKGTPQDPNFGYHGPEDYSRTLGEGQSCEDYVKHLKGKPEMTEISPTTSLTSSQPEYPPTHLLSDTTQSYPDMNYIPDNENIDQTENGILPQMVPGPDLEFGAGDVGIPGCGIGVEHKHSYSGFSCTHIDPDDTLEARMNELTCPANSQNTAIPGFEGHHTPVPGTGTSNPNPHKLRPWHLIPENYQSIGTYREPNPDKNSTNSDDILTFHYDPMTNMQTIPRNESGIKHRGRAGSMKDGVIQKLKKTVSR